MSATCGFTYAWVLAYFNPLDIIVVGITSGINLVVIAGCRVVTSSGTDPFVMVHSVGRVLASVVSPGTDLVVMGGSVG